VYIKNSSIASKFSHLIREYDNNQVTIDGELDDYIFPYLKYGERDGAINYIINKLPTSERTLFINLLEICDELRKYRIDTSEILNTGNWGVKPNGKVALFDIGFGNWFEMFDEEPQELNLDEVSDTYIQKYTNIAQKVTQKLNFNDLKYLGSGANGSAFQVNNDKVLKITADRSEAVNSNKIIGNNLDSIADIYGIYSLKIDEKPYYVIILEELDRSNIKNILRVYNKLEKWFTKRMNRHYDPKILGVIGKKHPMVSAFLMDLINTGYTPAWEKWVDKLRTNDTYDWNRISELSEWFKGSKTNDNYITDTPPEDIQALISSLYR
jgi:hypothetical protein